MCAFDIDHYLPGVKDSSVPNELAAWLRELTIKEREQVIWKLIEMDDWRLVSPALEMVRRTEVSDLFLQKVIRYAVRLCSFLICKARTVRPDRVL